MYGANPEGMTTQETKNNVHFYNGIMQAMKEQSLYLWSEEIRDTVKSVEFVQMGRYNITFATGWVVFGAWLK